MFPALGQGIEKGPPPLAKVEPGFCPPSIFLEKNKKKACLVRNSPVLFAAEAREELIRGINGLWLDWLLY
jgi:hypothetical protein